MVLFFGIVLAVVLASAAVVTVATAWAQTYFYENLVEGLSWRGPLAGAVLAAPLALWATIEYRTPGRIESPFTVRSSDQVSFDAFWTEVVDGPAPPREIRYAIKRGALGRIEYVDADGRPWRRGAGVVTAILAEENGSRTRFATRLGPDGHYLPDSRNPGRFAELEFLDGTGRVMRENTIGVVVIPRTTAVLTALGWALLQIAVGFAVLMLFLEFQWGHAFALSTLFWLATTLLVWPPLQAQAAAARATAAPLPNAKVG